MSLVTLLDPLILQFLVSPSTKRFDYSDNIVNLNEDLRLVELL